MVAKPQIKEVRTNETACSQADAQGTRRAQLQPQGTAHEVRQRQSKPHEGRYQTLNALLLSDHGV